ncbi:uncharacterized protein LOC109543282 [Dendroctonus ponderosae]|uniref:Protein Jumonji n=1 Tax=Dendroctonus ponderosae TaxID=77166 RepID=U4UNI3_DENPD|nr:uncharacterized protein LOC109543282 [Dendroctonus ponderosae]ERL91711.1 hypothetical protein D910_09038 [Dendroctonus ponderosae]KAH1002713.1 hypothetical protein HUJ04_008774 [Dendroctonus ponderosae]KAH1008717.1 hypothetical protein HUJ05_009249 [Dendroctonus ponderosae]
MKNLKRKRKEACPSPILDDSPKRTKVQAQRKFAQNSGLHSPIISPIRDLEADDLPDTSASPEPVELLPMKRPNTEDFLTFLCFRGTPILSPSLQFFNTASIVADGQVHEIKSESPKNGPIDIAKCAGNSEKPFIAFGVRKRADPIVISRQMEKKRRHALAIQALRRKYQEQKMAKIRALTISKLSEKTTNKTLVKTNTFQKTETVTRKTNTLQKTKVIATKHVKVTTQTLNTKVKPKMCLRSFRGKFVQKELPFRQRKLLAERDSISQRPVDIKKVLRTSRNSNKGCSTETRPQATTVKKLPDPKRTGASAQIPKPELSPSVRAPIVFTSSIKRTQMKRRISLPCTIVSTIIRPRLRSTTVKKSVISRKKAQQRTRTSFNKSSRQDKSIEIAKENTSKKPTHEKVATKKTPLNGTEATDSPQSPKAPEVSKRVTRRDFDLGKSDVRKEVAKNFEMTKQVKIDQLGTKKMVKKNLTMKRDFSLKTQTKDVKKRVAVQKTVDTVSERNELGQKITRDVKTVETTMEKVVTRRSEEARISKSPAQEETTVKENVQTPKEETSKRRSRSSISQSVDLPPDGKSPKTPSTDDDIGFAGFSRTCKSSNLSPILKLASSKLPEKITKDLPLNQAVQDSDKVPDTESDKESSRRITRDYGSRLSEPTAKRKSPNSTKKPRPGPFDVKVLKDCKKEPSSKKLDDEFSKKIQHIIDSALKEVQDLKHQQSKVLDQTCKSEHDKKEDNLKAIASGNSSVETHTQSCGQLQEKKEPLGALPQVKVETAMPEAPVEVQVKPTSVDLIAAKKPDQPMKLSKVRRFTSKPGEPLNAKKVHITAEDSEVFMTQSSPTYSAKSPEKEPLEVAQPEESMQEKPAIKKAKADQPTIEHSQKPAKEVASNKATRPNLLPKKSSDEYTKKKVVLRKEASEQCIAIASSRPSRKTKEAAAIYMEILSHKLVNESIIDDDISSDSFPELPNVKKTERRENELKAQAKTSKEEEKTAKKPSKPEAVAVAKPTTSTDKTFKAKPDKMETVKSEAAVLPSKPTGAKKRATPLTIASDDDSDNEVLLAKVRKCVVQRTGKTEDISKNWLISEEKSSTEQETAAKRPIRRCLQNLKESDTDSSDESFHIDIRVPRKKKNTRSRNVRAAPSPSFLQQSVDIILQAARVLEEKPLEVLPSTESVSKSCEIPESSKKCEPAKEAKALISDSDESTTSDINLKSLQVRQRNKKLSKKNNSKSSAKSIISFSDSDEEPLAKLTTKSIRSTNDTEDSKKKVHKPKPPKKTITRSELITDSITVMEPKPRRECTKRPSNYLPMLSSSDEDESYFHGFNTAKEDLKPTGFVQSLAPSLDLLSKDIGRKEKVNMSNEQIEQWLKDSALASRSVAKENDEMLKFGEKIPTEVATGGQIGVRVKPSVPDQLKLTIAKPEPISSKIEATLLGDKPKVKSPLMDRKWIFKKNKKESMPNKQAFSPENECSVYAFGEENEDIVSTPFRRPTRRPSSTATSRSEDELSKNDDSLKHGQFRKPNPSDSEDSRCFNIPQNPTKLPKINKSESMVPPSNYHSKRQTKTGAERFPEPFDDSKYKVPSSPSASSGSSAKLSKKGTQKAKGKAWESINPIYVSDFPKPTDPAKLVEAPVFHPTEQEFQDPLEYIERIRHKAEQFGLCKIIPPSSFKPECKVSDDMRFTAYNQYVHKMLHRWGPNFKEFIAIRKYLATQSIFLKTAPLIGGMEVDLPRLYQTVQSLGGLKEVIEKKKWSKVSDHMKIPKCAQDRVTKLDDIYCKYLLPYDTLSPAEREKLFDEVETYWAEKDSKATQVIADGKAEHKSEDSFDQEEYFDSDDIDTEECTLKGKNMALNAFYRIARNTMSMYFKVTDPTASEVEQEFWRYVTQKQNHICVHAASIDCGLWGYGFAVSKNSPFAKHPWNLKVLSNNNGSVLRSLGPVMGVTVPTLHVGMVFSACCWYRDPHGLPWIEYLHTGGSKVWYGIPSSSCEVFHAAMQKLVPNYCRAKELWLPSDTAMVPPGMLMEHNVSLCRTIQEPGQFIVVFPKVFTSSISTGYVVSESVYFAPLHWLKTARNLFNDLKNNCEPSMFSLNKLIVQIANDSRSSVEVLRVIVPFIEELVANENENRRKIRALAQITQERMTSTESLAKKKRIQNVDGDLECEVCRTNLFVSMIVDTQEDLIYCLEDAIKLVEHNSEMGKRLKLRYCMDESELTNISVKIHSVIEGKLQKKLTNKQPLLPSNPSKSLLSI